MAHPKSKIYYAVAYLRLSREDGDKGESNSITNQQKTDSGLCIKIKGH